MTQDRFYYLAQRFDALAHSDPGRHRRRITGLVLLGYGYLLGVLLLLLLFNVALTLLLLRTHTAALAGKVLIAQGAITWAVLRSFWVPLRPPEGVPVTERDAPALFALIGELRARLQTSAVHTVLITPLLNASMTQLPRWGVFGGFRNYLSVGLPLLHAMPSDEVRALIAHELAHLSAQHSRRGIWVFRVRRTWEQLDGTLHARDSRALWLFRRFARWYQPYLEAATLALVRADEFEADRLAAAAAGAEPAARGLIRSAWLAREEEEVLWPAFVGEADRTPEPPRGWSSHHCGALSSLPPGSPAWLEEALAKTTGPYDTHPALGARVRALGAGKPPADALHPVAGAAAELLGPFCGVLMQRLDEDWLAVATPQWRARHQQVAWEEERLRELETLPPEREPSAEEALERAILVEARRGGEAALPLYAGLAPGQPRARLALGRLLLHPAGDEAGVAELEAAVKAEPALATEAAPLAADYLAARGRHDETEVWWTRARLQADEDAAADRERRAVHARERSLPATLDGEVIAALRSILSRDRAVKRAWLVRRVLRHRPERPAHLLVIDTGYWRLRRQATLRKRVGAIADQILFAAEIYVIDASQARSGSRVRRVKGSLIYDRSGRKAPAQ